MKVKRKKSNSCGVSLPGGLADISKGRKVSEAKNKNNTTPGSRNTGGY